MYYKNEELENFMKLQKALPRYAPLARKALSHYLADLYDPLSCECSLEFTFRAFIQGFVKLKVFDRQPYDWPVIDNLFRYTLFHWGFKHLSYDMSILNKGYNGVMRGELPTHHA